VGPDRCYEEALARRAAILEQYNDVFGTTYTDSLGNIYDRYTYQRIAFVDNLGRICDPVTYMPFRNY
jgi:hypothetical protein